MKLLAFLCKERFISTFTIQLIRLFHCHHVCFLSWTYVRFFFYVVTITQALVFVNYTGNIIFYSSFSNTSATSTSNSRIFKCCGHTLSHFPHLMQSEAFPLFAV